MSFRCRKSFELFSWREREKKKREGGREGGREGEREREREREREQQKPNIPSIGRCI